MVNTALHFLSCLYMIGGALVAGLVLTGLTLGLLVWLLRWPLVGMAMFYLGTQVFK